MNTRSRFVSQPRRSPGSTSFAATRSGPCYLRRLLHAPDGSEVATHTEALAILTRLARDSRTTAAIALERALRDRHDDASLDDDLARILGN